MSANQKLRRRAVDLILIMVSGGLLAAGAVGIGSAARGADPVPAWSPPASGVASPTRVRPSATALPAPTAHGEVSPTRHPITTAREHRSESPAAHRPGVPAVLRIKRLGIEMPIRPVGVGPDGRMALPDRPAVVGWYRYGPRPGDPVGSAVLGGHVDSYRYGVGPLARLRSARPGDHLTVTTATRPLFFRVVNVGLINKEQFPARALFDRTGAPRLWLVTCGGAFDPRHGGYQDNLVVEAAPA